MKFLVAVHGGAVPSLSSKFDVEQAFLGGLASSLANDLENGCGALDVVHTALRQLEECGLFVAGRGASPNSIGEYELDASIADGSTRRSVGVAGLVGIKHPSEACFKLLEARHEALWAGEGARTLAVELGCETILDPHEWYRPRFASFDDTLGSGYGTAGVVVRDYGGNFAAGTTTGGIVEKYPGRIGDSPIIGAGTWADQAVAVSCTGDGKAFVRAAAAAYVAHRQELTEESLDASVKHALDRVALYRGTGAIVAVGQGDRPTVLHNSAGVKFAYRNETGGAGGLTSYL